VLKTENFFDCTECCRQDLNCKNGELPVKDSDKLPPRFRKILEQAEAMRGMGLIFGGLTALGIGGAKMNEFSRHAKGLVAQANELASLPENFNKHFQSDGWLISESTSVEAAKSAIALYDQGKRAEAIELLCTQFEGERLDYLLMRIKSIPEFRPRYEIARLAATLSQAGQFTAAIPLIFIALDGIASDALGKSIFSEGVDVSETKAIAGSADGFPELIAEVSAVRRKTNVDEITFPYRNGIMHGKDVNYGNRCVSAKCWSVLSCLGDILRAKRTIEEADDERPLIGVLKDYAKTREVGQRMTQWSPRDYVDILGDGTIADQNFAEGSPEQILCEFLEFWRQSNYGKMGDLTVYFDMRSTGRRAGQIRNDLGELRIIEARILEVKDEAPATAEIRCALVLNVNSKEITDEFCFRLIYMDDDMSPLLRGEPSGRWLVMPSYQGWGLGKRFGR
jgi:hypothetical protein